jgi:hypothetical protein
MDDCFQQKNGPHEAAPAYDPTGLTASAGFAPRLAKLEKIVAHSCSRAFQASDLA